MNRIESKRPEINQSIKSIQRRRAESAAEHVTLARMPTSARAHTPIPTPTARLKTHRSVSLRAFGALCELGRHGDAAALAAVLKPLLPLVTDANDAHQTGGAISLAAILAAAGAATAAGVAGACTDGAPPTGRDPRAAALMDASKIARRHANVDVSTNAMQDTGAAQLGRALRALPALRRVDLSYNNLTDAADTACSAYACMFRFMSATRSGWSRARIATEASVSKAWSTGT